MTPADKGKAVKLISERSEIPEAIGTVAYEAAADPQKGFARDSRLGLEGFRTVVEPRSESPGTLGTDPTDPREYPRLSYDERAPTMP